MTIDGDFCGGIIELDNPVHSTLRSPIRLNGSQTLIKKLIPSRFQSPKRNQNIGESESELGEEAGGDQQDDDILQRMRAGMELALYI